jgi:hypothetical protein
MDKSKKKKLFIFFLLLLIFLLGANFIFAQRELELGYPEVPGTETPTTESSLPDYIKYVFNFSILIAGLVAFGALVLGGIKYLTSAGSATAIKGAKDQIFAGILGLIILLSSYFILTTINPQLTVLQLGLLKEIVVPEVPEPPPPPELATLVAAEIPLGQLIDGIGKEISERYPYYTYQGVIAKERLERIQTLSDSIASTSKEIVVLSEQLKGLLENCNCDPCLSECKGGCYIKHEGDESVCVDMCGCICKGGKGTPGDPCPNREAIMRVQEELSEKAGILQALNNKLELEIEDLKEVLEQLERAKEMMEECPTLVIREMKLLYSMSNFWTITEVLEKGGFLKELKNGRPWLPIMGESDPASFYCTEVPVLPSEVAEAEKIKAQLEESAETETTCEIEIQIGYVTEESKKFTQELIEKMELMSALVSSQITATRIIIPLPDQCNCQDGESTKEHPHEKCPCRCVCNEFCASCIFVSDEDKCHCPENEEECWCVVCPCEKVKAIVYKIECIHNEIDKVHSEILKIIDEEKKLWKEMTEVRRELSECINDDEDWMDFLLGAAMLENDILSCGEAKAAKLIDSCQHEDNYFCCQTKFK